MRLGFVLGMFGKSAKIVTACLEVADRSDHLYLCPDGPKTAPRQPKTAPNWHENGPKKAPNEVIMVPS